MQMGCLLLYYIFILIGHCIQTVPFDQNILSIDFLQDTQYVYTVQCTPSTSYFFVAQFHFLFFVCKQDNSAKGLRFNKLINNIQSIIAWPLIIFISLNSKAYAREFFPLINMVITKPLGRCSLLWMWIDWNYLRTTQRTTNPLTMKYIQMMWMVEIYFERSRFNVWLFHLKMGEIFIL